MTTELIEQLAASVGVRLLPEPELPEPSPIEHIAPGTVFVLERKTSSEDLSAGSTFWARKTLDVQPAMYLAAESRADCVVYDALRKPALDPLLATPPEKRQYKKDGSLYARQRVRDETPEEYFERLCDDIASRPDFYYQRAIVVRMRDELEASALALWHIAEEILFARPRDAWPMAPSSCFDFGRRCEFHGVCSGEDSIGNDLRFETRPIKTRLPLLSASAIEVWNSCHRKYYYAYELRRRAREKSDALAFGTRMHAALEAWSLHGLSAAITAAIGTEYDYSAAKAHAMILGYDARWSREPMAFEATEREFTAPLVHPITGDVSEHFLLGGTMDGVCVKKETVT